MSKEACGRYFTWALEGEPPLHDRFDPECERCQDVNSDAPDWTI